VIGPNKSGTLNANLVKVEDNEDGTYSIRFVPTEEGPYKIHVEIFGRTIQDENYSVEISQHNNPLKVWGKGEVCKKLIFVF
jgi:hypothetical protein